MSVSPLSFELVLNGDDAPALVVTENAAGATLTAAAVGVGLYCVYGVPRDLTGYSIIPRLDGPGRPVLLRAVVDGDEVGPASYMSEPDDDGRLYVQTFGGRPGALGPAWASGSLRCDYFDQP